MTGIQPPMRRWYPDGMSTQFAPPPPTEQRSLRRRWIPVTLKLVAILAVISTVSAIWIGMKVYRQQAAIRQIVQCGGWYGTFPGAIRRGPDWIQQRIGDTWMAAF